MRDPSADTRTRLLHAAGEVFANVGYGAASVREICAGAGVNVASVNYHFRNKLGLYTEVVREAVRAADMKAVNAALDSHKPAAKILRDVIRARLRSLSSGDRLDWAFRIMAHEMERPTPALSRVVEEVIRPAYDRLRRVVARITGAPPDDEKTRLCVYSIMGQVLFFAKGGPIPNLLWPGLKRISQPVDRIADHIADFSLAYLHTHSRKKK
jgi:AcrR family transcriptional regulator